MKNIENDTFILGKCNENVNIIGFESLMLSASETSLSPLCKHVMHRQGLLKAVKK